MEAISQSDKGKQVTYVHQPTLIAQRHLKQFIATYEGYLKVDCCVNII